MRGDALYNKKGQVTIYIIIAIAIIVLGILVYFFYPKITASIVLEENPGRYLQSCLEDDLGNNAKILGIQGGSFEPETTFNYMGDKIKYLCYTNQYYVPCVNQQPLLKKSVEKELKVSMEQKVEACFRSLEEDYSAKGYKVELGKGEFEVKLLPGEIHLSIERNLKITKDSTKQYESYNIILNNNLYELVNLARDIVDWEVFFGDMDTSSFMVYYPEFKFEKKIQSDGTKIYIITERATQNKFQFASRSIVWPKGIALPPVEK